jgi:hypothetical protein
MCKGPLVFEAERIQKTCGMPEKTVVILKAKCAVDREPASRRPGMGGSASPTLRGICKKRQPC